MSNATINIIENTYGQTGKSKKTNSLGMREMQEKAYELRNSKHILIKAPPASGKSRALMYIALDKLHNQGLKKIIVAVPETSIGSSFSNTNLSEGGFFTDWIVEPRNNLCAGSGDDKSKVSAFVRFMKSDDQILVCTHATLRFAFIEIKPKEFDNCVLDIDK